jgi:hypothetical protein
MSHDSTEHHLEEAHHAHEHGDDFNKRVAMSMVVIAALLATVKVIGHRSHNDTLRYQIEANVKNTEAGGYHTRADQLHTRASTTRAREAAKRTEAANQWAYSQAKKLRQHYYDVQGDILSFVPSAAASGESEKKKKEWKDQAKEYNKQATEIQDLARKLDAKAKELEDAAVELEEAAEKPEEKAEKLEEEAKELQEQSHLAHRKSDRYDLGELALELGLVLCSVAILTKQRNFWYGGIGCSLVGLIVTLTGFFVH